MADERKADLIAQLARARSQAAANSQALSDDLQLGDKLKGNIDRHRAAWLSGAVLTGLIVSKLPPRTKQIVVDHRGNKVEKEAEKAGMVGLLLAGAKMLFGLVRPMLMKWVTARLSQRSLQSGPPRRRPV